MNCRVEILKAFERESNRFFSTSMLVDAVYPRQMHAIREQLQFGDKERKHASQQEKSKLHRKILYYIGTLVDEGVIAVARVDAHGEKIYQLAQPTVQVHSNGSTITIAQHPLHTHYIEREMEESSIRIYEEASVLSRFDAFYLDCSRADGLGHVLQRTEIALRMTSDVVCLGEFQLLVDRYNRDDLDEFLSNLQLLTLDEAKQVCLLLDTRKAAVAEFVDLVMSRGLKRVQFVLVADHKSLMTPDVTACIAAVQARREKINIHYAPLHPYPIFVGKAGPYGVQEAEWTSYRTELPADLPGFIVSQTTVCIDMERLSQTPAHDMRKTILNAAKTLHALVSQQRLLHTSIGELTKLYSEPALLFHSASAYIRFWNYDWERTSLVINSVIADVTRFTRTQETIYRACDLPYHCSIQLSSTFSKFAKDLSPRRYRKWRIQSVRDMQSTAFQEYSRERLKHLQMFANIDRMRVFHASNTAQEQITQEIMFLANAGFPLITIDFSPLQNVRPLTEYFA